jgi:hypothetical protein
LDIAEKPALAGLPQKAKKPKNARRRTLTLDMACISLRSFVQFALVAY